MERIVCYPAKPSIKIGYQFSPDYYDVTDIKEYDEGEGSGIGMTCCLENWGDCILSARDRLDLSKMENLFEKSQPGWKPVHLTYEGEGTWGDIYTVMVPPDFKIGDPIYFNPKTMKVEFK